MNLKRPFPWFVTAVVGLLFFIGYLVWPEFIESATDVVSLVIVLFVSFVIEGLFNDAQKRDEEYKANTVARLHKIRDAIQTAHARRSSRGGHQEIVAGSDVSMDQWNLLTETIHGTVTQTQERLGFSPNHQAGRLLRTVNPLKGLQHSAYSESPARSSVGLSIIIGVGGTFLGISLGLLFTDTSSVQGTQQLLNGMKTAFGTSLIGLFFAGLLTHRLAKSKAQRRNALETAQDEIDALTLPMSTAHLLGQQDPQQAKEAANANQKAADKLANTADALQESVGQLAQAADGLSADAIGQQVGQQVRGAINEQLRPVFQEISDELETLREIKADQGQETLELLIEQMRNEVLEPMGQQLQASAKLTADAIESVDNLREVVEEAVSHMRDDLENIRSFQDETLEQMRTFAADLQTHVETVMDESLASVERMADDVTAMVDDGKTAMEAQRTAFDESTEHAKQAFSDVGERLGAALDAHTDEAEQMFDRVADNVESVQHRFEAAFAEQNDILQSIGDEASATMREASDELAASTRHIRTVLSQMREVTQDELEQFRIAYQDNLEDFFVAQNNLLEETLGQQREALEGAVDSFREAMQESAEEQRALLGLMDERLDSMVETVEEIGATMLGTVQEIEGFAERLGLTTGERTEELQDMTDELTKTVHILRSQTETMRQELQQAHSLSQDNLDTYIRRTEEMQLQFFESADEAISELGNKLLDISDGVDYAAETLVSAVEHQRNGH